jgi:hypothetical protein
MNPKRHGNSFEWEVCGSFSRFWSKGARGDLFGRTDSSGGRATTRAKTGQETEGQFGDMCATADEGKIVERNWHVELKTGYSQKRKQALDKRKVLTNWCILDLIDTTQKLTVFEEFWLQCLEGANHTGREPILVFRRTRLQKCIAFEYDYFSYLMDYFGNPPIETPLIHIETLDYSIVIMLLTNFFTWLEPSELLFRRKQ